MILSHKFVVGSENPPNFELIKNLNCSLTECQTAFCNCVANLYIFVYVLVGYLFKLADPRDFVHFNPMGKQYL